MTLTGDRDCCNEDLDRLHGKLAYSEVLDVMSRGYL